MTHDFKLFPELTNSQMQFYYFESPHKQITEDFFAKVVKVVDGDTVILRTDFRDFDFKMRLSIINAPELKEIGGLESAIWLKEKVEGENVYIEIDKNNRVEKWGRLLGKLICKGMDMGEASLNTGHSVVFGDLNFKMEMDKQWA